MERMLMNGIKPDLHYPAISRYPIGSFGWAMDQVLAGNDMRRACWPIEVYKKGEKRIGDSGYRSEDYVAIWHVYICNDNFCSMCKGFSSGVCCADNDQVGDLGIDSYGYYATAEDKAATDWQYVRDVTPEQIAWHDEHRVLHISCDIHGRYGPLPEKLHDTYHTMMLIYCLIAILVIMTMAMVWGL